MRAARGGVPRVHIIDGRVEEGLLAEVFSNEGIGTLIHANEYQAIRRATASDARGHPRPDPGEHRERRADAAHARRRSNARSTISSSSRWIATRSPAPPCTCIRERKQGRAGLRVRRCPLRKPGHRRQADAVRRDAGPRRRHRAVVLSVDAGVQLLPAKGRLHSPARRTTCRRPAANATNAAAGARRCCSRS